MRLNRNGWQDPSEVLVIDQKQYTISELDRKSWAEVFAPPAQRAAPDNIRTVNGFIERWEQPTKSQRPCSAISKTST